jgi:hypothetical protein
MTVTDVAPQERIKQLQAEENQARTVWGKLVRDRRSLDSRILELAQQIERTRLERQALAKAPSSLSPNESDPGFRPGSDPTSGGQRGQSTPARLP